MSRPDRKERSRQHLCATAATAAEQGNREAAEDDDEDPVEAVNRAVLQAITLGGTAEEWAEACAFFAYTPAPASPKNCSAPTRASEMDSYTPCGTS